jgi:hypothetical protein
VPTEVERLARIEPILQSQEKSLMGGRRLMGQGDKVLRLLAEGRDKEARAALAEYRRATEEFPERHHDESDSDGP